MAVLPHYSPGYPEWDIAEQPRLLELIRRTRNQSLPAAIDVLESGMLRPKKSLLAVFGLTQHTERVRRLTDLVPCENCSLDAVPVPPGAVRAGAPQPSEVGVAAGVDASDEPSRTRSPSSRRSTRTRSTPSTPRRCAAGPTSG